MKILECLPQDIDRIVPLAEYWVKTGDFWSWEEIAKTISHHQTSQWLSFNGDQVTGMIFVNWMMDDSELLYVFVHPEYRGQGIARKLFQPYFAAAQGKSTARLFLEVRKSNLGAIKLYEDMGYRPVGERKSYYSDGETAVIYEKNI